MLRESIGYGLEGSAEVGYGVVVADAVVVVLDGKRYTFEVTSHPFVGNATVFPYFFIGCDMDGDEVDVGETIVKVYQSWFVDDVDGARPRKLRKG